jgi:hypothetical protein
MPPGVGTPPALELLQEHGAQGLAFVCLTHPHEDHYSGLSQILEAFEGRIDEFWVFPIDSRHRRKFLLRQHEKNSSGGPTGWARYHELESIFRSLNGMERAGLGQTLVGGVRKSIAGVDIECLSPLSNDLNRYQSALARSNNIQDYRAEENLLSVVLRLRYCGNSVLLSSDAPHSAWPAIWKRANKQLASEAVKVSHHGAKSGYHSGIWDHIRSRNGTHAAISCGVRYGHPDSEVINALHRLGVHLHCTNYPEECLKNRALDISKFRGLSGTLWLGLSMLDKSMNKMSSTCNGDIRFELGPDGSCQVYNQVENFCPLHLAAA